MIDTSNISAYQPAINTPSRQAGNIATYQQSGQLRQQESFNLTTDTVTLSYSTESVLTYDSSMTLQGNQADGFDLLRGLVINILKDQGIDAKFVADDAEIDLNTLTSEEAQELVADDGYFGVEKTSQRIFDLAVGIAGGDPARLDAIRAGVEQGFQEAYDAFGGWLPDISYDTYDAVMKKLDDWAGVESSQQA
ncbi:MAG: hypothetical protein OEL83_13055 [Desulforhopalus sp.]|nr:hypothetical protein [Desulforhopalus sp.]